MSSTATAERCCYSFSGQGVSIPTLCDDLRIACENTPVLWDTLKQVLAAVASRISQLEDAQHDQDPKVVEVARFLATIAVENDDTKTNINYIAFFDPEKEGSFYQWLSNCPKDETITTVPFRGLYRCEYSFVLIGIAALIHYRFFAHQGAKGAEAPVVIGHSQGVLAKEFVQDIARGMPEDEVITRSANLHLNIALSAACGAAKLEKLSKMVLPPLAKKPEIFGASDSAMLSISSADRGIVEEAIKATNSRLDDLIKEALKEDKDDILAQFNNEDIKAITDLLSKADRWVGLSVINGESDFMASGPHLALQYLGEALVAQKKKHPSMKLQFQDITAPFHSDGLMSLPLYESLSWMETKDEDRWMETKMDAESVFNKVVDYPTELQQAREKVVVCFGPGSPGHAAQFAALGLQRRSQLFVATPSWTVGKKADLPESLLSLGVQAMTAIMTGAKEGETEEKSLMTLPSSETLPTEGTEDHSEPATPDLTPVETAPSPEARLAAWLSASAPVTVARRTVIREGQGKAAEISTSFTRMSGLGPVLVGGMTPSTSLNNKDLIVAALNAGYHIELAGGGIQRPAQLVDAIKYISDNLTRSVGIHFNILYMPPMKKFEWQWKTLIDMKAAGYPIDSVTFGGGSPDQKKAVSLIDEMEEVGMRYLSFKPANMNDVKKIVRISAERPAFPICVQITGGLSGGHHSKMDQKSFLREAIPAFRAQKNIHVIVGGGVGSAEDVKTYLSGSWSGEGSPEALASFGADGVVVGSLVTTAEECATADSVKTLLQMTDGVKDLFGNEGAWEKCDRSPAALAKSQAGCPFEASFDQIGYGGVVSVNSEMGFPIHVLANKCGRFWKQMDEFVFYKKDEKTGVWEKRETDDTKEQIKTHRRAIINGLTHYSQKPWFSPSTSLAEMRFGEVMSRYMHLCGHGPRDDDWEFADLWTIAQEWQWFDPSYKNKFYQIKEKLNLDTPESLQRCAAPSVDFLLHVFYKQRGKPMPFVAALDAEMLETCYKKDSLWVVEQPEAIPNEDPERVFVLAGPVAVNRINEARPVKDLLDGLQEGLTDAPWFERVEAPEGDELVDLIDPSSKDPKESEWLTVLSEWQGASSFLAAILNDRVWTTGQRQETNHLRKVFTYASDGRTLRRSGARLIVEDGLFTVSVETVKTKVGEASPASYTEAKVTLQYEAATIEETLCYHAGRPAGCRLSGFSWEAVWLKLYKRVWTVDGGPTKLGLVYDKVEDYPAPGPAFVEMAPNMMNAQYEIQVVWPCMASIITGIGGDLSKLLHQSYSSRWSAELPDAYMGLEAGSQYRTTGRFTSYRKEANSVKASCLIEVYDPLFQEGQSPVLYVTSSFVVLQNSELTASFKDMPALFVMDEWTQDVCVKAEFSHELQHLLEALPDDVDIKATLLEAGDVKLTRKLHFASTGGVVFLEVRILHPSGGCASWKEWIPLDWAPKNGAERAWAEADSLSGKVLNILLGKGLLSKPSHSDPVPLPIERAVFEKCPTFTAPADMNQYSRDSKDVNPIHTSKTMATIAGLKGPIVHGMWTLQKAKKVFEATLCDPKSVSPRKVDSFEGSFVNKVFPGEELALQAYLTGYHNGAQLYRVEVATLRGVVFKATARVLPNNQVVGWPGQGTAVQAMGKPIRESGCPEARAFWARSEAHFVKTYGISIQHIIDQNPKEYTVNFNGAAGRDVRENLMGLRDSSDTQLLKDLHPSSPSYTFRSEGGLLNATYFQQPAILINSETQFLELQAKGLVDKENMVVCGHSLGEFGALTSVGLFDAESVVDVAFFRGLSMDKFVERSKDGSSEFGMMACDPKRAAMNGFELLKDLPSTLEEFKSSQRVLADPENMFIAIGNYNVENEQYALFGHKAALLCFVTHLEGDQSAGPLVPEKFCNFDLQLPTKRGSAGANRFFKVGCTAIAGIDVPFHTSKLKPSVPGFRRYLETKVLSGRASLVTSLEGRYIPNLTGAPFEINKDYGSLIQEMMRTGHMDEDETLNEMLLDSSLWVEDRPRDEATRDKVAINYATNLLANQIACSVQWTQTMAHILGKTSIPISRDRVALLGKKRDFFECGQKPTITGLIEKTMKHGYYTRERPWAPPCLAAYSELHKWNGDYTSKRFPVTQAESPADALKAFVVQPKEGLDSDSTAESTASTPEKKSPVVPSGVPIPTGLSIPLVAAPAPVQSASVKTPDEWNSGSKWTLMAMKCIISNAMSKSYDDIQGEMTIEELSGGQSTATNQCVSSLEKEFPSLGDGISTKKISELAEAVKGYDKPGERSKSMISKIMWPSGFTPKNAKQHLGTKGIGEKRSEAVLLLGSASPMEMKTKASAMAFLDATAEIYAGEVGISLDSPTAATPIPFQSFMPAMAGTPAGAGPIREMADEYLPADMAMRAMISNAMGKSYDDVKGEMTIEELSGGQSTATNECTSTLTKEFPSLGDGISTKKISELAQSVSGYTGPGAQSTSMISKIMWPSGFTPRSAKDYLKTLGLGEKRADAIFLFAAADPASIPNMKAKADATAFLESAAQVYASRAGVTLPSPDATPMQSPMGMSPGMFFGGGGGPVEDEELRQKVEQLSKDLLTACSAFNGEGQMKEIITSADELKKHSAALQKKAGLYDAELGDEFLKGLESVFDGKKSRSYESSWAWAERDAMVFIWVVEMFVKGTGGEPKALEDTLLDESHPFHRQLYLRVWNRLTKRSETYLRKALETLSKSHPAHQEVWDRLETYCRLYSVERLDGRPTSAMGDCSPSQGLPAAASGFAYAEITQPWLTLSEGPNYIRALEVPKAEGIVTDGLLVGTADDPSAFNDLFQQSLSLICRPEHGSPPMDLTGKTILITGCSPGSIGMELLKHVLACNAYVIITSSRPFSKQRADVYQKVFEQHAGVDASLRIAPFNGSSTVDVKNLIEWIYTGLGRDLDFVVPNAALPQEGKDIEHIDWKCELAHRLMAINVERLIGQIVTQKKKKYGKGNKYRPCLAILPCSPNHGIFGKDGLYAASKIALETLGNKSVSEGWQSYVSICNVTIGWTRGTNLMTHFDAQSTFLEHPLEGTGIRTFSNTEMALLVGAIMSEEVTQMAFDSPILADFSGGLNKSPKEIGQLFSEARSTIGQWNASLKQMASLKEGLEEPFRALCHERFPRACEDLQGLDAPPAPPGPQLSFDALRPVPAADVPHVTFRGLDLPNADFVSRKVGDYSRSRESKMRWEMLDLRKIPVIVGNGEIGPFLTGRARWDRELNGRLSQESLLEVCFLLGYIKARNPGAMEDQDCHMRWELAESGEPMEDKDVRSLFESKVADVTGIRIVTTEDLKRENYNSSVDATGIDTPYFQAVEFSRDAPPMTLRMEDALKFAKSQPDEVIIIEREEGMAEMKVLAGAQLLLPAKMAEGFALAALIPAEFDFQKHGLTDDLDKVLDFAAKATVWATAEALMSAGVTDPSEFYQHAHQAEVGNSIGGGFGGMASLRSVFLDRTLKGRTELPYGADRDVNVQNFSEVFINTAPAWVNMLIMGSNGPIRPAVGACGTSALSLENAVDSIMKGDARVMLAGATDDYTRQVHYEFCKMGASRTLSAEQAVGRDPCEASRPCSTTRGGFLESHGAGVHVVCDAELALTLGLPIRAVIPHVASAMDGFQRSVPAPGNGILSSAAEGFPASLTLREKYNNFTRAKQHAERRLKEDLESPDLPSKSDTYMASREALFYEEVNSIKAVYGHGGDRQATGASKLRSALDIWGLTPEDITVASFHGTSTEKNDINESETIQAQMTHLGRSEYPKESLVRPIAVVCQKSLTGHPKGPAASWMLNGAMDMFEKNAIPGNFNLDDVDAKLRRNNQLLYTNESINAEVKSCLLKSFGFGQVGAEILAVNPRYLLELVPSQQKEDYEYKLSQRNLKTKALRADILAGRATVLGHAVKPFGKEKDPKKEKENKLQRKEGLLKARTSRYQ